MVNYGVSKACQECKERKKKCDKTRPSCVRCTRAGRKCPGYQPDSDLVFRNISGVPHQHSHHRLNNISPHENWPKSITPSEPGNLRWPELEQIAFQTFISHYCIPTANRTVSRGYLAGLPSLIENAGPASDIAHASKIIALANLGKTLSSPVIIRKVRTMYSGLLSSFSLTISNEATSTTIQSLMTAVLLGLFEIIMSTSTQPGAHIAHARGVSAILTSESSPFDLLCGGKLFRLASPLPLEDLQMTNSNYVSTSSSPKIKSERFSILCTPLLRASWPTLDTFFVKTYSLVWKAQTVSGKEARSWEELKSLGKEAEQIRKEFPMGEMTPLQEWKSVFIGIIPDKRNGIKLQAGYWPGPVSTYYDLYVASILNSYRKARLLILNMIVECHRAAIPPSQDTEIDSSIWNEIQELTSDITASIPYHLAENVEAFFNQSLASDGITKEMIPGRSAGGLVLMQTLYMVSTLSVVNPVLRTYFKDCLAWIGENMGIGQATMLSELREPTGNYDLCDYMGEAHLLIWASMLI